jgi:hypothetical protein
MFVEKDLQLLGEVFTLARLHTVNSAPDNEAAIVNIINFKNVIVQKIEAANKELGAEIVPEVRTEEVVGEDKGSQLSE